MNNDKKQSSEIAERASWMVGEMAMEAQLAMLSPPMAGCIELARQAVREQGEERRKIVVETAHKLYRAMQDLTHGETLLVLEALLVLCYSEMPIQLKRLWFGVAEPMVLDKNLLMKAWESEEK